MIAELKKSRRLQRDVFRLISGIENENKATLDVMNILGVKKKQTLFRRKRFTPAEQIAIEKIFEKYGVNSNIWTNVDQTRK